MRRCRRPGCAGTIAATGFCGSCLRRDLPPVSDPEPPPVPDPQGAPDGGPEAGGPLAPGPAAERAGGAGPDAGAPAAGPGRDAEPDGPARPAAGPDAAAGSGDGTTADARGQRPRTARPNGAPPPLEADGLVALPEVPVPDPGDLLHDDPGPPTPRRCGADGCREVIGVGYGGRPPLTRGFCPRCGAPYSFEPPLRAGDKVDDGHYRVLGLLARSGLGWVYLAEDTRVDGHLVVLKGLIDAHHDALRLNAVEEGRRLTSLHHRDIVGIVTRISHRSPGEERATVYIVMEFVAGWTLRRLLEPRWRGQLSGEPFLFDHVVTYGCKILGALEYLHDQHLLYCDVKPDNVIHYGRQIKIIDLGAIRRIGDDTSPLVHTGCYSPPKAERDQGGFGPDFDLYTVGRTLGELAQSAEPAHPLAARSFRKVIQRATHPERAARFRSAAEMSRQLWEVLREHRALSAHEQYGDRSTVFEPTPALFGGELGVIPPPRRWAEPVPNSARGLETAPPAAGTVAAGLPVPIPRADDPAAGRLPKLAPGHPREVADRWSRQDDPPTPEAALWLCRAFAARGEPDAAQRWLRTASAGSPHAPYDWRFDWHRGVIHLLRDEIAQAQGEFAAVHTALPGEWAPKLALGYCAERQAADRDDRRAADDAEAYYTAVWRRDAAQASAAFGLVRSHLRRGERAEAVAVLDEVPPTSYHVTAARIAAVRVHAGCLPGRPPTTGDLTEAARRLTALPLDWGEAEGRARQRLLAEVRETAWLCAPEDGWGEGFPAGEVFGPRGGRDDLARLLAATFRRMARSTAERGLRHQLFDREGQVRPETPF